MTAPYDGVPPLDDDEIDEVEVVEVDEVDEPNEAEVEDGELLIDRPDDQFGADDDPDAEQDTGVIREPEGETP